MNHFIRVLLGEETLPEWDEVYNEFIDLRENKGRSFIMKLLNEITYLQNKQYIIFTLVSFISNYAQMGRQCRDLIIELKLTGCKGKFDWSDKVGFSNDLRAAISYGKRYTSQINKKEKEIEDYNKKYSANKLERKYFDEWQAELSQFMGSYVDYDIITVSYWCSIMNKYEKYAEVKNAESNNMLNKKNGRR